MGVKAEAIPADTDVHHIVLEDWARMEDARGVLFVSMPTLLDPSLAPEGHHIVHAFTPDWVDAWQGMSVEEYEVGRAGLNLPVCCAVLRCAALRWVSLCCAMLLCCGNGLSHLGHMEVVPKAWPLLAAAVSYICGQGQLGIHRNGLLVACRLRRSGWRMRSASD